MLAALGYATGSADAGAWNDSLSQAYRAFLRDAGLPASETLTPRGLRRLREVARAEGVAAGAPAPVDTAPDSASDTLHRAVVSGDIDGAQALLSGGAAVDDRDNQGWTPLMHAANKGYVLLVEILLQAGASPDVRAPDGATALFIAVMNGHPEAIALLMRAGASVSIRGPRGLTAADAARLIYGDDEGQRPVPDDAEVHALLGGMTWGDAVKAAIAERRVETDPAAIEASLGLDRKARVQVQRRLSTLGFSPGPADGVFGRRTRLAIGSWQEAKGLTKTGYLTREQADALVSGDEEDRAEQARIAREQAEREAREKSQQEEAERERELLLWTSVEESGDPSDFETYLEAYPGGEYEALARGRLNTLLAEDDAAYARTKGAGTEAAYEAYLSAYPSGRHAAEVRGALAREREPRRPGRVFRDCAGCPEMVVVPAGEFRMGSPLHEAGRKDDEGPVHRVVIAEPFAAGVYEVTFAEWDACVSGGACGAYRPDDEGWGRGNRPVVNMNWEDAQAYVRWLSEEAGEEYRLLSESEWEYVARGGTGTARYWGEGESGQCRHANGADRSAKRKYGDLVKAIGCDDGYVHTAPVGSFSPNPFGLHDVLGNVLEWVEDCWHDGYDGAPSDGGAWTRGGDCGRRVVRGCSWICEPEFLRSAFRSPGVSRDRFAGTGFRVARTLD